MVKSPRETFWRTLTTFTATRIFIALLLLLYLSFNSGKPASDIEQAVYWEACIGYLLLAFGFAASALFHRRGFLLQLTAQVVADIVVVSILYSVSGGGRSGLAILYLFPLAGSAIPAGIDLNVGTFAATAVTVTNETSVQLITPAGKTFTRESYLHAIESGELNYAKWEIGPMQVRVSERMAMVRYQAKLVFASGNSIRCWHSDLYELIDEEWRAVWSQATAYSSVS